jgi:hypothetical protein
MSGAIPPLHQHAFMEWCSVKAQGHLYLYLNRLFNNTVLSAEAMLCRMRHGRRFINVKSLIIREEAVKSYLKERPLHLLEGLSNTTKTSVGLAGSRLRFEPIISRMLSLGGLERI